MYRPSVLLVYSDDHPIHSSVIASLARVLTVSANANVHLDQNELIAAGWRYFFSSGIHLMKCFTLLSLQKIFKLVYLHSQIIQFLELFYFYFLNITFSRNATLPLAGRQHRELVSRAARALALHYPHPDGLAASLPKTPLSRSLRSRFRYYRQSRFQRIPFFTERPPLKFLQFYSEKALKI